MLGDRLIELRESKKLTRKAVAEFLQMTPEGYGYYESGKRKPSPDVLTMLADFFQVSTDYLLGRTDNPAQLNQEDEVRFEDIDYAFYEGMPEKLSHEEKSQIIAFARFMREERRKEDLGK